MPPARRKEVKEAVSYTFPKRKAAPFIPQRPSKLPRSDSTSHEHMAASSSRTKEAHTRDRENSMPHAGNRVNDFQRPQVPHHNKSNARAVSPIRSVESVSVSSDSSLDEDPLAAKRTSAKAPSTSLTNIYKAMGAATGPGKSIQRSNLRKPPGQIPTTDLVGSNDEDDIEGIMQARSSTAAALALLPSDEEAVIPRALLLRILHEHFESKTTQIDTKAIAVFGKYIEIFVREAVARSALAKEQAVADGKAKLEDKDWLEVEDLEKVVAGLVLDF